MSYCHHITVIYLFLYKIIYDIKNYALCFNRIF